MCIESFNCFAGVKKAAKKCEEKSKSEKEEEQKRRKETERQKNYRDEMAARHIEREKRKVVYQSHYIIGKASQKGYKIGTDLN